MKTLDKELIMTTFQQQQHFKQWGVQLLLALALVTFLPSCSSRNHVRHLASDAILIVPHQSTQKEVISLLGHPEQRRNLANGVEEWIFVQTQQSFLRKTPYIGTSLGRADFDIVVIYFKNKLVTSSTYRQLTEEEFKASGIKSANQLNAK